MNQNGERLATSIPSRALDVWRRLYTRYTLEPGPATVSPDVSKTIVPVTQADLLLARHRAVAVTTSPGGTGDHVVHTVPVGIRRAFVTLRIARATGTFTFDLVQVTDISEATTVTIAPQAQTDNFFLDPQPGLIELEAGDIVRVNIDAFTSGTIRMESWVIDQDLF